MLRRTWGRVGLLAALDSAAPSAVPIGVTAGRVILPPCLTADLNHVRVDRAPSGLSGELCSLIRDWAL